MTLSSLQPPSQEGEELVGGGGSKNQDFIDSFNFPQLDGVLCTYLARADISLIFVPSLFEVFVNTSGNNCWRGLGEVTKRMEIISLIFFT